MPRGEYYAGLSLADAVERMAEYHFDPNTRHISQAEYELLQRAAIVLRQHSSLSG